MKKRASKQVSVSTDSLNQVSNPGTFAFCPHQLQCSISLLETSELAVLRHTDSHGWTWCRWCKVSEVTQKEHLQVPRPRRPNTIMFLKCIPSTWLWAYADGAAPQVASFHFTRKRPQIRAKKVCSIDDVLSSVWTCWTSATCPSL